MEQLYNIIEVANVHEGKIEYLKNLIKNYSEIQGINGIKFQPFKYDEIATEDFSWYPVYQQLYFDDKSWNEVINIAKNIWDVWIDTFDSYSFSIIEQNLKSITGLKFQASVLYNLHLLQQFKKIDLSEKKLILNISGIELNEIEKIISHFKKYINSNEIILQIGFQSYPTNLENSGLNKISILKEKYGYPISFADHISPDNSDANYLPIIAYMRGATIIEKHIRLNGEKPKFDFQSSMDETQYTQFIKNIKSYEQLLLNKQFINQEEKKYLKNSIQIPILKHSSENFTIPNLERDFLFKRSNLNGLRANEIEHLIHTHHIIQNNKSNNETLQYEDFKKANMATIIACRLKSSRLSRKALLKIGDLTSVELCIKSALSFKNTNYTILATSTVDEDNELKNYTYKPNVLFHQGHPEDVINRYLDVIEEKNIDIIFRITADMPFVSHEIAEILLKSHFENGADYTAANRFSIGTSMEIISAKALKRVKNYFPNALFSEYMTYYFTYNPTYFNINKVDLPQEYIRNYRLTLDYPEDLEMLNQVAYHLINNNLQFNLQNIFQFLDENPEVAKINENMHVRYLQDTTLIDTLKQHCTIH